MKLSILFLFITILLLLSSLFIYRLFVTKKKLKEARVNIKHLERSKNSALEYIEALWTNQQTMMLDEKISSLSSLVAGVAHELNTPLGVALTALTYLDDIEMDDDVKPMIELTKNNLQKSITLVKRFTEISGGDMNTDFNPVEFHEFLDYTSCLVKTPLANKHINKLKINVPENLWINTSEATLSIIIKNILENAFDYAFADNRRGEVSIISITENSDLTLIIKDNGPGMTDREIAHIFEPFYTTRRPERHYGLGLAIAYNLIARQHNGYLTCKSEQGVGTEILITIPDVICHAPEKIKRTIQN